MTEDVKLSEQIEDFKKEYKKFMSQFDPLGLKEEKKFEELWNILFPDKSVELEISGDMKKMFEYFETKQSIKFPDDLKKVFTCKNLLDVMDKRMSFEGFISSADIEKRFYRFDEKKENENDYFMCLMRDSTGAMYYVGWKKDDQICRIYRSCNEKRVELYTRQGLIAFLIFLNSMEDLIDSMIATNAIG